MALLLLTSTAVSLDIKSVAQRLLLTSPECVVATRQVVRETLAQHLWHTVPKWKELGRPTLFLNNKLFLKTVCPEGREALLAIGYRENGKRLTYAEGALPEAGFELLGSLNAADTRTTTREAELSSMLHEASSRQQDPTFNVPDRESYLYEDILPL